VLYQANLFSILYFKKESFLDINWTNPTDRTVFKEAMQIVTQNTVWKASYRRYSYEGTSWFILCSLWKMSHQQVCLVVVEDLRKFWCQSLLVDNTVIWIKGRGRSLV